MTELISEIWINCASDLSAQLGLSCSVVEENRGEETEFSCRLGATELLLLQARNYGFHVHYQVWENGLVKSEDNTLTASNLNDVPSLRKDVTFIARFVVDSWMSNLAAARMLKLK